MSEIPFLDRLGDALEEAAGGARPRRRIGAAGAFAVAFAVVLAIGASWWALQRPTPQAAAPTTTTTLDSEPVGPSPLPSGFARVPHTAAFEDGSYFHLGGLHVLDGRFVAVGSTAGGGVVLVSDDGLTWDRRQGPHGSTAADASLIVDGSLIVGGMDVAQGPGVWREEASGEWSRLPLPSSGVALAAVRDLAVGGDGLLAVGQAISGIEQDATVAAVVWTGAGDEWRRIDHPSFAGVIEVDANGVSVGPDRTVVGGVWAEREGQPHAVVWVTADLESWERVELPVLEDLDAGSWATDVVWTGSQFVAVGGERLIEGTVGAVWTSPDGSSWVRQPHDAALLGVEGPGELRLNRLELIDDGILALGVRSAGIESSGLVLASQDGVTWDRIDLVDPSTRSSSTAGAAQIGQTVLVTGAVDIATGSIRGAAWVSPVPPGMVAAEPSPEAPDQAGPTLTVLPDVVAATARVKVTVDLGDRPRPEPPGDVFVAGPAGDVLACSITFAAGYPPWCDFYPDEIGLSEPGRLEVSVEVDGEVIADGSFEVVASGTVVARLSVTYLPYVGPPVQSVYVRNHGDEPLDLTGWTLDNIARTHPVVFPAGLVLDPGGVAGVVDGPAGSRDCGTYRGNVLVVCGDFSGGPDDPVVDPGMEAYSSGVVLLDPQGVEVDSWSPLQES